MESKQIAKVEPRSHDHLLLVFTDGTQLMVMRDEHRAQGLSHQEASPNTPHAKVTVHHLKPGDWYPPLPAAKEPTDDERAIMIIKAHGYSDETALSVLFQFGAKRIIADEAAEPFPDARVSA
jgi:hypothetical protein